MNQTPTRPYIQEAIRLAGSQAKLAAAAGVSQNAIYAALKNGRVSVSMADLIDKATGGQVPRWKLRPDIWTPPDKPSRRAHRDGFAPLSAGTSQD